MATHQAQAYQDPGTPEEQTRRTFLANATLGVGTVIGLVLTVPMLASLVPESLLKPELSAGGTWAPLPPDGFTALQSSTNNPVKLTFTFKYQDSYLPPSDDTQFVWGVKLTPEQEQTFKAKRPDLYVKKSGAVNYPAITMSFVVFSSVCPHLGCRFKWVKDQNRFVCPCHGSEFGIQGDHLAGPAPRGLDPLPLREANGKAEITWIDYKSQQPDRVVIAYS